MSHTISLLFVCQADSLRPIIADPFPAVKGVIPYYFLPSCAIFFLSGTPLLFWLHF
ncbi:hypothetical protein BACCAP_03541 [Pseudoflavonifractor capillosus ATCC 29799]|uniref:Uncharacterized protein n=1 Tax=Pseudoflavonifractor capillosus ATCC 29799 TaxID=411467 RepID=A6NZ91_9FIRM|nr:hypothetical protein BACCAP_03541 [Pseudoflavonifractor capillosus ATCC 29799]